MNRKIKNLISAILIVIMCGTIAFTMLYAKNNLTSNSQTQASNASGEMQPPEKPDGNSGDSSSQPPEMPSGDNGDSGDSTSQPPEMPSDDNGDSGDSTSQPPEMPSGDNGDSGDSTSQPPEMPSGDNGDSGNMMPATQPTTQSITYIYYIIFGIEIFILSLIILYLIMSKFNKYSRKETFSSTKKMIIYILCVAVITAGLTFTCGYVTNHYLLSNASANNAQGQAPNGMPGNMSDSDVAYSGATEISADTTEASGSYDSSTADENSLLVDNGSNVTLSDITVSKTGDSDGGDNTSFYGINSAILAKDGATLTLKGITVTTDATGANGVFCYGGSATTNNSSSDNTTINISDSKITTTKDNSGGIMTTGGGITNATNLTINTAGTSSAAIRTDRGGGTVNVDGGTYNTTGLGSPCVYSTANVSVKNATLTATKSEGIIVEGKNSVSIDNVDLTDTNNDLNGLSTTYKNIFLYQSMSGDAADGIAEFDASNSNITTNQGDTFYVTNTTAAINLTNNTIVNNDTTGNFLRIQKDSWGTEGSNGGVVTLTMDNQKVTGNIVVDSISTLDMTMKNGSSYEGTINGDNSAKELKLTLDKNSKIKLTGDSYVTSLEDDVTDYSNIDFNGFKLYVNGKAIN